MQNNEKKQVISRLVKDKIEFITACFDEYYFTIPEGIIKPDTKNAKNFQIGDTLPLKGETYDFPENFNLIDLHFKLVAKIRETKLYDIIHVKDFIYDQLPAVNMMGFSIRLSSETDFHEFKRHLLYHNC